jgi:acyl carrier protein phosphodiesterase
MKLISKEEVLKACEEAGCGFEIIENMMIIKDYINQVPTISKEVFVNIDELIEEYGHIVGKEKGLYIYSKRDINTIRQALSDMEQERKDRDEVEQSLSKMVLNQQFYLDKIEEALNEYYQTLNANTFEDTVSRILKEETNG